MRKAVYDTYQCGLCGTLYGTAAEAAACEQYGSPDPRFACGTTVQFRPGAGPAGTIDETFTVERTEVILSTAAGQGGTDSRHAVGYVLRNHVGRVGFIAEELLTPAHNQA